MKQLFMQHKLVASVMVLLLVLSIICQIIIGFLYGAGPLRAYLDKFKITKNENEKD